MTNSKQIVIRWIGQKVGEDIFVIVHSKEITLDLVYEAQRRFAAGKIVSGFVPIVFLDPELDSAESREFLQSQAGHRFFSWCESRKGK